MRDRERAEFPDRRLLNLHSRQPVIAQKPNGSRSLEGRGRMVSVPAAIPPDLNQIEMAFAKLKIRRAAAGTCDDLWQAVGQVCDLFTEDECHNFFKAAGYETD